MTRQTTTIGIVVPSIPNMPIGPPTYQADRLESYEIGYKAETPDRRFALDIAAYVIDWNNIQLYANIEGFSGVANAPGGAQVKGGELTLTARPVPGLAVSGAFAYQSAELAEDNPDLGGRKGDTLPNVPRTTAAVSADYQLPWGVSARPTIGGTVRYVDDRQASFDAKAFAPQYQLPDYTAVDLRTGLSFERYDFQLYVRNLFDERGQLSAYTTRGRPQPSIMQPRTIGIVASARF